MSMPSHNIFLSDVISNTKIYTRCYLILTRYHYFLACKYERTLKAGISNSDEVVLYINLSGSVLDEEFVVDLPFGYKRNYRSIFDAREILRIFKRIHVKMLIVFNDFDYRSQAVSSSITYEHLALFEEGLESYIEKKNTLMKRIKGFILHLIGIKNVNSTGIGHGKADYIIVVSDNSFNWRCEPRIKINIPAVVRNVVSDDYFFLSQPLVIDRILTENEYTKYLLKLIDAEFDVKYVLHPRESLEDYSVDMQIFLKRNFNMVRLPDTFESCLDQGIISPLSVFTIFSGASANSKLWYDIPSYMLFLRDETNDKIKSGQRVLLTAGVEIYE